MDNGKQTDGFHIPGRAKNFNEFYPDVQNTNPDYIGDGTSAPYWKIYNTASVIGNAVGNPINNATPYQYGEFAYWESTDVYPCNEAVWGDLANTPIRHHKFPDVLVSPIFESGVPTIAYDGTYTNLKMENAATYPIGVKIDIQQVYQFIASSNLTQDQKDSVVGFKIVRGNRSTNTSIIAKGILRNLGEYEREGTSYYFPNYPYNDLRTDPFLLTENNAYDAVCREYQITITTNTTITYYNCDTAEETTLAATAGTTVNVCSTTFPTLTAPTDGAITATNYGTYQICSNAFAAGNRFSYFPPTAKEATTIWVAGGFLSPNCSVVNSITKPIQIEGSGKYTITLQTEHTGLANCTVSVDQLQAFNNDKSPYRFVFNSPETSFGKPFLGNIIKLESAIYGAGSAHFVQVTKNAMYKLISKEAQEDALKSSEDIAGITTPFSATAMFTAYQAYLQIYINGITRKNYARSYNSIAKYNYWSPIDNNLGVKQRELDLYQYLIPGVQNVGDDLNINNYDRESSVYIKTIGTRDGNSVASLPYPSETPSLLIGGGTNSAIEDKSRYTISEKNNCLQPENQFDISTVTYYGSLKNIANNQWGQIYSYETIDTGFQNILSNTSSTVGIVFGGDTFISGFAFKTKLPFFIDNRVGAPDDSDIFYDEIGNVAYPKYWHSARSILSNYTATDPASSATAEMKNIISIKAHNFDCPNSQAVGSPGRTYYSGSFYLFAYGIPTFYCETAVNVDLRQAFNNREGDFFPHVSTGIPDNWLQQSYVPISQDNTYYYNTTFSKQNKENYFSHLPIDWNGNQCYTNFPFRAIYSDRQQSFTDNRINSWLIYRPISFFDFPQNYGKLVSLDGIQNRAILARFENKSLLYNTMLTVETSNPQAAYLGNDTLFRSAPPIDFAETDLGYVGAQNKMLLKIPQGQITVDAKRGQVFLIAGNQAQDLSGFGSGLNRFFTDHLAFEILRYFPNVPTDNHFNGVGLHGVYDSKYDRVIISKLDYIPQNSNVKYDSAINEFYVERIIPQNGENASPAIIREIVYLTDVEYFCNKSWTLSFNVNTKSWVSFHSYIPNWYIGENNFFYSGLNAGCDLHAIAVQEVPATTTSTTTYIPDCNMDGTAVNITPDCSLEGTAAVSTQTTTTTTSTSSTSTTTTTSTSTTSTSTSTTTTSTTTAVPTATFAGSFIVAVDATSQKAFTVIDTSSVTGHFPTTNVAIGATSAAINASGTLTAAQGALKIGLPPNPTPNVVATIVSNTGAATNATITTSTALGYLQIIITPNSYPSTVTLSGTVTIKYIAPTTTTTTTTAPPTTTTTTSTSTSTTTTSTSTSTSTTTSTSTSTTTTSTTTAIPTTTTSTTTAAPVYNLSGNFSTDACIGTPGCNDFRFTYDGSASLCFCTGIFVLLASQSCFDANVSPGATFWVSNGINVRAFTRIGSTYTATTAGGCTSCGTTTSTTTNPS